MKDLSIGGIVMLNRTDKGDKEEEIVEPMEVKVFCQSALKSCCLTSILEGEQGVNRERGRRR